MRQEFERVAIVNRGECAMRFIHAADEFNQEHGTSIRTIALFTEPDRRAMFVREANEAVSLGAPYITDPGTHQVKSSYVDYACLERALTEARADAVWVGWGFVAEHADFADLCRELGLVFIGPDGGVMRRLGDKISSKLLAERAQVPVAPWSGGAVETVADALHHGERLEYPLLIKATAGGGGHGIRRVNSASEVETAFAGARAEAFKAFGNPTVFMEQLVENAHHVEVQVIADQYGTVWAAGVRDCTIQRRHQKVMEEAPSPVLSPKQDEALREAAVRLAQAAGYQSAGTVEFLYRPESQHFSFLEMNTRLQVEHPVTECTTGLDLVKLQIHVARGGRLEGEPPLPTGHSIEVRLNAEDPDNNFAPAPGTIERFKIPMGPGLRIDTGVAVGDVVPAEFDSMIAKIIAHGQSRAEALARLRRALRESVVVLKGGSSNKAFLLDLLNRAEVQRNEIDIGWLDRLTSRNGHVSKQYCDVALVQAAIEAYETDLSVERSQFYASAVRGRPHVRSEVGRTVELRHQGHPYSLRVFRRGPQQYRVECGDVHVDTHVDHLGQFESWLTGSGRRFHVVSVPNGLAYRIEVDGVSHRIDRDDGGVVHAPSPAVVVSIAVKPGDTVAAGDRLAVLEAMKMEMQIVAPFAGKVRQVMTIPNVQVDTGVPLLQLDPITTDRVSSATADLPFGVSFASDDTQTSSARKQNLHDVRQFLLGFDVDPLHAARILKEWSQYREASAESADLRRAEDEILSIFVDVCSLFGRQPEMDDPASGENPSPEAYLFTYLRTIETGGEGLPPAFVDALRRALAHYGLTTLDRSPELEESLLWIYKSHQRVEQQVAPILSLLEHRLKRVEAMAPHEESFRSLLDRMISVTRGQFATISELAQELRYRCFDQPLFEQARRQAYEQVEAHLACLDADPHAPDRHARIRELVDCPQPLVGLLSGRFANADKALRQLMLEVLTRRYYRIRTLAGFRSFEIERQCCISAEYDEKGKLVQVLTTHAEFSRLTEAARALIPSIEEVAENHDVVIDFYLWHPGWNGDAEAGQRDIHAMLNQTGLPRLIRRIVVTVAGPNRGEGIGAVQHYTYRLSEGGYAEEKLYRGLHPMMGKRQNLWRLNNFDIDRVLTVEDVYLFHGIARDNPKDERLFASAEVRDLTPVRDESGRVVQLPHLERMLAETLAAIRAFQSKRPVRERLYWNRVLLYVWPPLTLEPDELRAIVNKLAPSTEGLGLEQVVVRARIPNPESGELRDTLVHISSPGGSGMLITFRPVGKLQPLKPLSEYDQKVMRMRQRGLLYPYEIIKMLTPAREDTGAEFPAGEFVEHDLDAENRLVPVERPYGQNKANIIAGVMRNFTTKHPEGMTRVLLMGDPSKDLGAIAESECRRIIAGLDLATELGVPLEWFPISAGAKISMSSGVENMDWIGRVLRRIIEYTQAGGEVNLLVDGINVGAQPYWNSEATMLMHTRGILVMTPKAAMVLTGKRSLDFSGGVSAEDNLGIGGYDRIMGLNGQAQYWARDINDACHILFRHYEHTYVAPGERFPRKALTTDPIDRDVQNSPHQNSNGNGFTRVGDIFSDDTNPGRKHSFEIRRVMKAVIDQDYAPLERWPGMRAAEMAVVWDAHLGGNPVCLIGIESRPVPRLGFVPADGPDQWTGGTLFPSSSKKLARAINAASNNRPLVLLANLSGFDGSPESLRKLQLEYGAEIGRAVVNFKGPMVFCVISRYHGGAYVVFSKVLNENLEVVALEGTYVSVIGGAPAAAVVFAGEVEKRARKDPRLAALSQALAKAEGAEKGRLRAQFEELFKIIHSEKLGEMAGEFDHVHNVHRALEVGALHRIIPPATLRPYLIQAIARGIEKELQSKAELASPTKASVVQPAVASAATQILDPVAPFNTGTTVINQTPELAAGSNA